MNKTQPDQPLPAIPVIEDARTPGELFTKQADRSRGLLQVARKAYTPLLLNILDALSKKWASKRNFPYMDDVRAVAEGLGKPGGYMMNFSYEWACTTTATPDPQGQGVRLFRALDWPVKGMGDQVVVAKHEGEAGSYTSMTYPGFVGVLQGVAPGRFAVAINQAPMQDYGLGLAGNWLIARFKANSHKTGIPPTFLLRQVFEQCADYESAVQKLKDAPLCVPALFTITGVNADEHCIIERQPDAAIVHRDAICVGNHWLNDQWRGLDRPIKSRDRVAYMNEHGDGLKGDFDWMVPPVLNDHTRLAFEANARTGTLKVQGWEADKPVTAVLDMICR